MQKYNSEIPCRICNHQCQDTFMRDLPTEFGERYGLIRCRACGFISINPLPSPDILNKYYHRNYWQPSQTIASGILMRHYRCRMKGILNELKRHTAPGGRILDWGSGDGAFVQLLSNEGYESYGIDRYSTKPCSGRLFNATIESAPFVPHSLDAITCFHVLEHLADPVSAISSAFKLLKPSGVLVIEVPNIDSTGFKLFKNKWYPLSIPYHLNHFKPFVLQNLIIDDGKNQIIKISHFSHRHSPSSFLLSLLPSLSPPTIRARHDGRFPIPYLILYLILQLIVYPLPIISSAMGRGEVIRMIVRKTVS